MSSQIILRRMFQRWSLAIILIIAITALVLLFVRELTGNNPNAALVGLLNSSTAVLGIALLEVVKAITSNPSDQNPDVQNGPTPPG